MRIRYRILFLGLVAIAWIAINLPASLVRHLVDPSAATFVAPSGTVWQGASQIISPIGSVSYTHLTLPTIMPV